LLDLFKNARYDFIGRRKWAYAASAAALVVSLASLTWHGLRSDIDFAGGVLVQVRFERPPNMETIRATLSTVGLAHSVIQEFGDAREYILRMRQSAHRSADVAKEVAAALAGESALGPFDMRRVEIVGPQIGHDLQVQAVYAVIAALAGMLLYIGIRFDLKGGVAAVVAVVHDVTVCLGVMSLTAREMSLPVLAALLVVVGYSVNDTIVAYDRLRENRSKRPSNPTPFARQLNDAINQTLSRTVMTSLSTLLPALTLFGFGGRTLEDFAFVMSFGIVTGTYSTVYIASALIVDWTLLVESRARRASAPVEGPRQRPLGR
jgi:preprotein translocase subunit SecF